jgi:hypothetical protein
MLKMECGAVLEEPSAQLLAACERNDLEQIDKILGESSERIAYQDIYNALMAGCDRQYVGAVTKIIEKVGTRIPDIYLEHIFDNVCKKLSAEVGQAFFHSNVINAVDAHSLSILLKHMEENSGQYTSYLKKFLDKQCLGTMTSDKIGDLVFFWSFEKGSLGFLNDIIGQSGDKIDHKKWGLIIAMAKTTNLEASWYLEGFMASHYRQPALTASEVLSSRTSWAEYCLRMRGMDNTSKKM